MMHSGAAVKLATIEDETGQNLLSGSAAGIDRASGQQTDWITADSSRQRSETVSADRRDGAGHPDIVDAARSPRSARRRNIAPSPNASLGHSMAFASRDRGSRGTSPALPLSQI